MILEQALLEVIAGKEEAFISSFVQASKIISATDGCLSVRLSRCLENTNQFLLLVEWETLEHHTVGFRQSEQYQLWRRLLHHFYDPFPTVLHFDAVLLDK